MKFTCSVIINKPKNVVADYFINPDYLGEYQDGFIKKELISGSASKENAVSKLYYKQGKGQMELTETVLENNLPDIFKAFYFHTHTENTMQSTFTALDENTTRYDAEIHYTKFKGFIVKVMKTLFPNFFKKQVEKWLKNFKLFVEKQ
ncbi:MAG: hypothetical protein ACPGUU_09055 [Flavobacteriaceae bacterium]